MNREPQPPILSYNSPAGGINDPAWSEGNFLLVRDRTVLPPRCLKCTATDNLKMKTCKLAWVPPLMYLLLLFPGLLIGGLILLITQKKASIGIHACAACRRRLLKHTLIALAIFLGSLVAFAAAIVLQNAPLALAGVTLLLASLVYAVVKPRLFQTVRIADGVARLKGVSPAFLHSLGAA